MDKSGEKKGVGRASCLVGRDGDGRVHATCLGLAASELLLAERPANPLGGAHPQATRGPDGKLANCHSPVRAMVCWCGEGLLLIEHGGRRAKGFLCCSVR